MAEVLYGESLRKYQFFHSPRVNGQLVRPIRYLTYPFRRGDVKESLEVSEGWDYSQRSKKIQGEMPHRAVDYKEEKGVPVYAPCNGFVIASYHHKLLTKKSSSGIEEIVRYQGKPLGIALGLFVQIFNLELNRTIQIAHLDSISENIPFSKPISDGNKGWLPTNYNLPFEQIIQKYPKMIVPIKRGQFLGTVGNSGLIWGDYDEYHEGDDMIDTSLSNQSWDIPHVHQIEATRVIDKKSTDGTTVRTCARDVFALYRVSDEDNPYPTYKTLNQGSRRGLGPNHLFYIDNSTGLPLFADDKISER